MFGNEYIWNFYIKDRINFYNISGLLQTAGKHCNIYGEYSNSAFLRWLDFASVWLNNFDNLMQEYLFRENNIIDLRFAGFPNTFPLENIKIKTDMFLTFQEFLNYVYSLIHNHVKRFTYGIKWQLFSLTGGSIIRKLERNDVRTLIAAGIKNNDTIICKLH
ncbi:MAG: hypothetical protein WCJ01_06810 [Ignavibacteria bacterium]